MQPRRDSACCEPACHEPLSGMSVSEIAERGLRVSADPLPVGCPSRTYRASCNSTVVSHRLRRWLGESVPQQSVCRVTQDSLNRLVAGARFRLIAPPSFHSRARTAAARIPPSRFPTTVVTDTLSHPITSEYTIVNAAGAADGVVTTALRHLGIGNGQAECARIVRSMLPSDRYVALRNG